MQTLPVVCKFKSCTCNTLGYRILGNLYKQTMIYVDIEALSLIKCVEFLFLLGLSTLVHMYSLLAVNAQFRLTFFS